MPEETDSPSGPFDLEKLKELIEMMETHGLSEVYLKRGEEQWRLRRGPHGGAAVLPYQQGPPPPPMPVPSAETGAGAPAPKVEGPIIKSPTVGTFYSAATPDDPPFVRVGDQVQPDTVVCIVEAMKVFNQITADTSGTIVEVLVANGDAVEFGQPLFRVRP